MATSRCFNRGLLSLPEGYGRCVALATTDAAEQGVDLHAIQHRLEALAGLGETDDLHGTFHFPVQQPRARSPAPGLSALWIGGVRGVMPCRASLP